MTTHNCYQVTSFMTIEVWNLVTSDQLWFGRDRRRNGRRMSPTRRQRRQRVEVINIPVILIKTFEVLQRSLSHRKTSKSEVFSNLPVRRGLGRRCRIATCCMQRFWISSQNFSKIGGELPDAALNVYRCRQEFPSRVWKKSGKVYSNFCNFR